MSISAAEQGEWDGDREMKLTFGRWIQDEVDKPIRHLQIAVGVVFLIQTAGLLFFQDSIAAEQIVAVWVRHLAYFGALGVLSFILTNRSRVVAVMLISLVVVMVFLSILNSLNSQTGSGMSIPSTILVIMCMRAAIGCFKYQSRKRGLMLSTD